MHLHHLAIAALVPLLPVVNAGGIARLSAVEDSSRRGRLLRSSIRKNASEDASHHGPMQLALLDATKLMDADAIELSFPSTILGYDELKEDNDHILYTYDVDWRDESGGGWHGKLRSSANNSGDGTLDGTLDGTAHFFIAAASSSLEGHRLAGMIHRSDGTTLRITTKPDGSHWFESWDDGSQALTVGSAIEEHDIEEQEEVAKDEENGAPNNEGRNLQTAAFGDDDGSVIDHLSVYTRRAMCEHAMVGYYPCPNTPYIRAPIEEFISLQYTVTNYVLTNTHVPTRLNSVHVFMDPEYDQVEHAKPIADADPDSSEIGVALQHLGNVDSGYLAEARRRRDVYCADVVTLFATIGAGLAKAPGSYSVVNAGSDGWGFAHEVGHMINAGHRNDASTKDGYKYGYGYGPDSSQPEYYATVMASGGKKVPMYSTPDYTWQGKVVGTATENNRQSIIDHLITTTNRRRSEMCNNSCEFGADGTTLGCPSSCSSCHFPPEFCYDDPFFKYNNDPANDCEYIRAKLREGSDKCDQVVFTEDGRKSRVKDQCQVACNSCQVVSTPIPTSTPTPEVCEDDPSFLKNDKGCDWVANSVDRCANNAGEGYPGGSKIYEYCRLTCGLCHTEGVTPSPTPGPCVDVPGLHFQTGTKNCDWVGEKVDPRCTKYSAAATLCPATCGLCDMPTPSPTARGPCADDESWVYDAQKDNYSFLTCEWVREDPVDRCIHSKMKHYCPVTCGTCCEDEPGWHYCINCPSGGNPDKNCAYYRAEGCNSNASLSHCPRTCGRCTNYLANAGGPYREWEELDERKRARNLRKGVDN